LSLLQRILVTGVLFVVFFPAMPLAKTRLGFADRLMAEGDYFRAISEYKAVMYYSDNISVKQHCLRQITAGYFKSNKYKSCIEYAARLLDGKAVDGENKTFANQYIGLGYYGLKVVPMAETYLQKAMQTDKKGSSLLFLALIDAEKGKYSDASSKFRELTEKYPHSPLTEQSQTYAAEILKGKGLETRSPFLATCFSAIVPGSGQLYSGHFYDGLQAFCYVGVFAYASYLTYEHDRDTKRYGNTYVMLSITGIFHLGNILGANRTARFYNKKKQELFVAPLRDKAFQMKW
jgi:tetratricopeptide (TPR) repeat protein